MVRTERLPKMETYIHDKNFVSMQELCKVFDISMNTLRQDIAILLQSGSIKKVYGGVCSDSSAKYTSFNERNMENIQIKRDIAKEAAKLIEEKEVIFIDSGSTTQFILDYLDPMMKLTILTTSFPVMNKITMMQNADLICLEGSYQHKTNSFIFIDAYNQMNKYNINKTFMATSGISEYGNLTNSSMPEFEVKQAAIKCSSKNYLLADSTKFGKTALLTYANIREMTTFITDSKIPKKFLKLCQEEGVKTLYV